MSKIKNYQLNKDGLKLCLTGQYDAFERIKNSDTKILWWGEYDSDFYTRRIEKESDETKQTVNIIIPDGSQKKSFGVLTIHRAGKYAGRSFLTIKNRALYDKFLMNLLPYVVASLGLDFNNITRLDICFDSPFNYIEKIEKAIRNIKKYDMIYNGEKVLDPLVKLENFLFIYGTSRTKKEQDPTLVFGHKKQTGIRVKVYDKVRELIEQSPYKKACLTKSLGFESDELYRIEVSLSNVEMRELCAKLSKKYYNEWDHSENLLNLLNLEQFLTAAFCSSLESVLYFRNKKNGKRIDILDL